VASGEGRLRLPVLLGAGASMYVGWNLGTAIGVSAGAVVPDPRRIGVDLVVPLTFLAVLVLQVRTRTAGVVAMVAAGTALVLLQVVPSGVAVLGAGVVGSLVGGWRTRFGPPCPPILGGERLSASDDVR
jgi:predicted branched-subunit amino acid permease